MTGLSILKKKGLKKRKYMISSFFIIKNRYTGRWNKGKDIYIINFEKMRIYLTTERWISLWISSICKFDNSKWRYEQEDEFKEKVAKATNKLEAINELSMHKFEKVWEFKYQCKDSFWNIKYLYVEDKLTPRDFERFLKMLKTMPISEVRDVLRDEFHLDLWEQQQVINVLEIMRK